jgi:N-acetylmuramic acid 6-phosphate etherase
MVRTGKVYENMMINLSPSNEKLKKRVIRITTEILHCSEESAIRKLEKNNWNIKNTIKQEKNNGNL